jgi:hypothetical protein
MPFAFRHPTICEGPFIFYQNYVRLKLVIGEYAGDQGFLLPNPAFAN